MSKQQIYLMKNDMGLYKIGISKHPKQRAKEVSTASGVPTTVIDQWESYNAYVTEQRLHRIFKEKRKSGEWFKFTKKDLILLVKYISDFDKLITHHSDTYYQSNPSTLPCQSLKALVTRKFSTGSIDDYCKVRDYQYSILKKEFKNLDTYFKLIQELKDSGYYIPWCWSTGQKNGVFSSLYEPTFSYFTRQYPICTQVEKAKLDVLYTESYLEDLSNNKVSMEQQLMRELQTLQSMVDK